MTNTPNPQEALHEIKSMMERSSRFLSLSGLSGIIIGMYAIAAALYLHYSYVTLENLTPIYMVGMGLIVISLLSGIVLTYRNSQLKGETIWNSMSRRLLINFCLPMLVGGAWCYALVRQSNFDVIPCVMLIVYGLTLLNLAKYSLEELRYLGYSEMVLGLMVAYYPSLYLECWVMGFGILHILYGAYMWWKYERN